LRGEKKDRAAYKIKKAGYKDLKKALGKNYDFFKKAELRRRIQSLCERPPPPLSMGLYRRLTWLTGGD